MGNAATPFGRLRQDEAVPTEPDTIELSLHELRDIAGYAADCARRVLPLFEQSHPADTRPRDAIDAARTFAGGAPRTAELRKRAWAAYKAAAEAASPAAADAARAASHAAAAAYLHPKASAHQVKHILGAAAHAARAEELAHAADAGESASGEPASGEARRLAAQALERARRQAPAAVTTVLGRLPAAPPGGGRVGEFLRILDAALRA
ncbi:putative immunity protein [Streptomyces angustmyceticus]|uniref:putative immunity protein n=1 Tax=Streptomyces angustmyceticus TaxID=285578 RepID=UPI00383020DC